ncbi:hypothetical protein LJB99_02820 [Deltaproteobacteria bacterium OttesenSCG-928-K17]|nr:hypothetical protein [Deltaproteobacteria bacterium OttesenSCG-928-K17]
MAKAPPQSGGALKARGRDGVLLPAGLSFIAPLGAESKFQARAVIINKNTPLRAFKSSVKSAAATFRRRSQVPRIFKIHAPKGQYAAVD